MVVAVTGPGSLGLRYQWGRLVPDEQAAALAPGLAGRLTRIGQERVFVLHWLGEPGDAERSIYLSQRDGRALQFAKAAIATGWSLLLGEPGLRPGDIREGLRPGSVGDVLAARDRVRPGRGA